MSMVCFIRPENSLRAHSQHRVQADGSLFARQDANNLVLEALVLAKHLTDLPRAHSDISSWHVSVRACRIIAAPQHNLHIAFKFSRRTPMSAASTAVSGLLNNVEPRYLDHLP